MTTKGNFLFLGTGSSMGIPVIGCQCPVCRSESPCNQRLRPSGLITIGKKQILVDCGPDFRMQALRYHISNLDGLMLTHAHHDHIAGIDDLRVMYMRTKTPLPCLVSEYTANDLRLRYGYIFKDHTDTMKITSRLDLQILDGDRGDTSFLGLDVHYFTYTQGGMPVNGYRIGNFAYVSDIRYFPETIYEDLEGIEILVLSTLRFDLSAFHFGIEEAIEFSTRVGATHTWLTHIAHELEHEAANSYLPSNVRMAYDGLELNFCL